MLDEAKIARLLREVDPFPDSVEQWSMIKLARFIAWVLRHGTVDAAETRTIADWQAKVLAQAKAKGWHEGEPSPDWIAARLALVHKEVSEALDCVRESRRDDLAEELADIVLRTMCVAAKLNIDLEAALAVKVAKNEGRTWSLESGLL
jgi:NTP pyrophosphatase (non-canonical NTP hydrolase)